MENKKSGIGTKIVAIGLGLSAIVTIYKEGKNIIKTTRELKIYLKSRNEKKEGKLISMIK